MNKIEQFAFVTCPMIFGITLIFIGMYAVKQRPEVPHGIILICAGIICLCLFAISSLLVKIFEKKEK